LLATFWRGACYGPADLIKIEYIHFVEKVFVFLSKKVFVSGSAYAYAFQMQVVVFFMLINSYCIIVRRCTATLHT